MAKAQQTGWLTLTSGEPGDVSVSVDTEPCNGPTDALLAEIAFIYAEARRAEVGTRH